MYPLFPWWIKYPNVNNEIQNLDWLMYTVKHLSKEVKEFINLNTIKYADPILWDITRQYEANTVVVDGQTGNAYISTQAVPSGVHLNRTDYWTQIYNYADALEDLRNQIATDEGNTSTASKSYAVGELVFVNELLYRVIAPMIAGDSFVVDSNIEKTTIEIEMYRLFNIINNEIGSLATLNTTDKSSIVNAINEVLTALTNASIDINGKIGSLSDLNTVDKTSIVNAINEVLDALTTAANYLGLRFLTDTEKRLQARNILFVGDSYGDESGEWPTVVKNNLGLSDDKCHIECVGGAGFVSNGVLLFKNQIENYSGDKNAITDIIICGGLNDSVSSVISDNWWNTLRNNITDFDTYAKANYPNADIHLGYIGNGNDYATGSLISGRVYECRQLCKYFYNEAAASLGWHVIPNVEFALATNAVNIGSDGVHPSVNGSFALGNAISEYIAGGVVEIKYPRYSPIAAGTYTGDYQLYYEVNNGRGHLHTDQWYMNINGATTLPSSFKIATLGSLQFNKSLSVNVTLQLHNFDNLTDVYVPARLLFSTDEVYCQILDANSHSSNTDGGTIYVIDFDVDFPIEYCV